MVDRYSMGPSIQLLGARFSKFCLRKLSREFKLRGMLILHKFQLAIFSILLEATVTWSGMLVVCIAHADMTLT